MTSIRKLAGGRESNLQPDDRQPSGKAALPRNQTNLAKWVRHKQTTGPMQPKSKYPEWMAQQMNGLPKDHQKPASPLDGPIEQAQMEAIDSLAKSHHKILDETCPQLALHVIYRRATAGIHKYMVNRDRKLGFQQAARETHTHTQKKRGRNMEAPGKHASPSREQE